MRKRIYRIAKGKFEYEKPELMISEKELHFEVFAGKDYEGCFTLGTSNQVMLRGMVHSSVSRMECLNARFEGKEIRVRYVFHGKGLSVGDRIEGRFDILCNQCTLQVPFTANVTLQCYESSVGRIRDLEDFVRLAGENWDEAYRLFTNPGFVNVIDPRNTHLNLVYRGLTAGRIYEQSMEEFLVAARKKERLTISCDRNSFCFTEITEKQTATVEIRKSTWGHSAIAVAADAPFIVLQSNNITDEMFAGHTCRFRFQVDPAKMHAGKNYASITFTLPYQSICVRVEAVLPARRTAEEKHLHAAIREYKTGLVELYAAYRLKRIGTGVWANETISILKKLREYEPQEPMNDLLMAQAYLVNRQIPEAEELLKEFEESWTDKKSPIWAYNLYLRTLEEREPSEVDRLTREIRIIFRHNPDSVLMFWILSFLEEEYYNNSANKLKAIEYWVKRGCHSPYLYLEAYMLIWQDPYLLSRLGDFEIHVLNWAMRQKALNKDIAVQIFEGLEYTRVFNPFVYRILEAAYEINPKPEYAGSICKYLIKGQKFEPQYLKWYKKGVAAELRLTGLYEAYLLSLDEEAKEIPRIIQMYFQYDSPLPYQKIALLYRDIISDKKRNGDLYEKYRRRMCKFAMKQAKKGRIDDNLAVIYNDMLELGLLNSDVAEGLSGIVFANKLTTKDPSIVKAIVYQWEKKEPQTVIVNQGTAYVQIYSEDYVILLEDRDGRRFESTVEYELQPLMDWKNYLPGCVELAPRQVPYLIASFRQKQSYTVCEPEDLDYMKLLMEEPSVSIQYKAELWPEYVHYLKKEKRTEDTLEFFYALDYSKLSADSRKYLMNVIVEDAYYDFAMELVQEYGIDQLTEINGLRLCDHIAEEMEEEDDDFLIQMAAVLFRRGHYTDRTLAYLCAFYVGPVSVMTRIFEAALSFAEIDTRGLEERILITTLFTDADPASVGAVFRHYLESGATEVVLMAYLSASCRRYLLEDADCDPILFEQIEGRYLRAQELNDVCRLALLKYFSTLGELPKQQYRTADELLREYTVRNMNFAFFKQLDTRLVNKYHLYDKMFLEYRSAPRRRVVLHYTTDESSKRYITEDLPETWNGIYVKQFVMFFGDMISYYITEEEDGRAITKESNRLLPDQIEGMGHNTRYHLLNQMLMSKVLRDDERMLGEMKRYKEKEEASVHLFKVLG